MHFGPIGDHALSFLGNAVLLSIRQIPPAVLHARVDSRLAFAKSLHAQRLRPRRLAVLVWIEINVECVGGVVVFGHAETNHLARLLVDPRRGMADMGWKNKM